MNKTKIVIVSLVIGAVSSYILLAANPFYFLFAGLPFGIAVILCLRIFFKHKTSINQSLAFTFSSTLACFVAAILFIRLLDFFNKNTLPIFGLFISSLVGSLIVIYSYTGILKIKFDRMHKLVLLGLGILSSLTIFINIFNFTTSSFGESSRPLDMGYVGVFIFWQSVMLAAIMYVTATIKENKNPETPLFLRKD